MKSSVLGKQGLDSTRSDARLRMDVEQGRANRDVGTQMDGRSNEREDVKKNGEMQVKEVKSHSQMRWPVRVSLKLRPFLRLEHS